jgi:hypothetical protein
VHAQTLHIQGRLKLLSELEAALGCELDGYTWADGTTIRSASAGDTAAAMADVRAGIAARAQTDRLQREARVLRNAADSALRLLERIEDDEPAGGQPGIRGAA